MYLSGWLALAKHEYDNDDCLSGQSDQMAQNINHPHRTIQVNWCSYEKKLRVELHSASCCFESYL